MSVYEMNQFIEALQNELFLSEWINVVQFLIMLALIAWLIWKHVKAKNSMRTLLEQLELKGAMLENAKLFPNQAVESQAIESAYQQGYNKGIIDTTRNYERDRQFFNDGQRFERDSITSHKALLGQNVSDDKKVIDTFLAMQRLYKELERSQPQILIEDEKGFFDTTGFEVLTEGDS